MILPLSCIRHGEDGDSRAESNDKEERSGEQEKCLK